jgi:hypothetical protein
MGSKSQEYKELFEKIDQEEDGEVYLRYMTVQYILMHCLMHIRNCQYQALNIDFDLIIFILENVLFIFMQVAVAHADACKFFYVSVAQYMNGVPSTDQLDKTSTVRTSRSYRSTAL